MGWGVEGAVEGIEGAQLIGGSGGGGVRTL